MIASDRSTGRRLAAGVLVCAAWTGGAGAQGLRPSLPAPPPPSPTGGAAILDRNRIDRAPPVAAPPPAGGAVAGAARVVRDSGAAAPFVLTDVQVQGSSLPLAVLRETMRPFIGRRIDGAGVNAVADALAAAYAKSDVALYTVSVPRQTSTAGVIRLMVAEGRLEGVDVTGDVPALVRKVRAISARLTAEAPLRRASLDRALLLIQSIPGATLKADFVRGSQVGAARLRLALTERRFKIGFGLSDRGQNLLGRTQLSATAEADSILRAGDQTVVVVAAPTDFRRFRYVALSHLQPIGDDGATVQGSIGRLTTRPQGTNLRGKATLASLRGGLPLKLTARESLTLTTSLDAVDSSNALLGSTISNERTRALRGALSYTRSIAEGQGALSAAATLSRGIDGLGARVVLKGYARPDFTKATLLAAVQRKYGRFTVRLRASGQISGDPLPSSEQMSLGGDDIGRAFASGVATGDEGAGGSAELAYSPVPQIPVLKTLEAYVFTDGGRTRTFSRPSLGLPGRTDELASAGLGGRITVAEHTALQVEAARALVGRTPYAKGDDWRLIVGLRSTF